MKWSSNNRACKTVWSVLMGLNQISETQPFKTTGDINIKDLAFFPQEDSNLVKERSHAFALQLDRVFRKIRGASYEQGVELQAAVDAMQAVLQDNTKTVADLADVADDQYLFFGEETSA